MRVGEGHKIKAAVELMHPARVPSSSLSLFPPPQTTNANALARSCALMDIEKIRIGGSRGKGRKEEEIPFFVRSSRRDSSAAQSESIGGAIIEL